MAHIDNEGMKLTLQIASYMRAKFSNALAQNNGIVSVPSDWSLTFLQECDQIVEVLVRATKNQKNTSWSVLDYVKYLKEKGPRATGTNPYFESQLSKMFPGLDSGVKTLEVNPFVLCDRDGNILVWYLPGSLKSQRQTSMWKGLETIEDSLVTSLRNGWRLHERYYMDPKDCQNFLPGTVSLSPAWFQQGHSKTDPLEVSAGLRKESGVAWIKEMKESSSLIGACLSIMHPHLFDAGILAMQTIFENPSLVTKRETLPQILKNWSSPFSGLSIINNRLETIDHRDNGAGYSSMDMMATVGPYRSGFMSFLGLEVSYPSGTLVGVSGRVIRHGVKSMGERACFAYFMRENVLEKLIIGDPTWTNITTIHSI